MSKQTKPARYMVGGCDLVDGTWRAVFETHEPCDGGNHIGCVVIGRNVSPPMDSKEAAIEAVLAIKDESGLDGWETTGITGKA